MKMCAFTPLCVCFTFSIATGSEFSLGLDVTAPQLREKQVVFVYFSNDRMAPRVRSKMDQVNGYLENALRGNGFLLGAENDRRTLTDDDVAFHEKLLDTEKSFLTAVGAFSSADGSETATTTESWATIRNVARKNPRYKMGFVLFRNFFQMALDHEGARFSYSHLASGAETNSWLQGEVPISDFPREVLDFPFVDQPLSHPAVIERLLAEVVKLYPPEEHRYVLVFKSQGGDGIALAPRYDVYPPAEVDYQKLVSELLKSKAELLQGHDEIPLQRGTNFRLSRILSRVAGKKTRSGVTLEQVMNLLAKSQGTFPLVFFDVNDLDFPEELRRPEVFPNVGTVFYTNQPVPYNVIDYDDLHSYLGVTATDFEDRMREYLREHLPHP